MVVVVAFTTSAGSVDHPVLRRLGHHHILGYTNNGTQTCSQSQQLQSDYERSCNHYLEFSELLTSNFTQLAPESGITFPYPSLLMKHLCLWVATNGTGQPEATPTMAPTPTVTTTFVPTPSPASSYLQPAAGPTQERCVLPAIGYYWRLDNFDRDSAGELAAPHQHCHFVLWKRICTDRILAS